MLVSVLASGSKGNSTLIKTKEYNLLIDAGMTTKYLENALRKHEMLLSEIDYIFITHTHSDHVNALKNLTKRYNPTIVMSSSMLEDLKYLKDYENIEIINDTLNIGNILIEVIPTSHDTNDSNGYVITKDNKSIVYITDTGYIHQKHFPKLTNKSIYIFESNFDPEMLSYGKYPRWLQRRILSPTGHLSNQDSASYLSRLIGPNTKKIILAHLSQDNNKKEIALETLEKTFKEKDINFTNILIAEQDNVTELIEI